MRTGVKAGMFAVLSIMPASARARRFLFWVSGSNWLDDFRISRELSPTRTFDVPSPQEAFALSAFGGGGVAGRPTGMQDRMVDSRDLRAVGSGAVRSRPRPYVLGAGCH